MKKQDNSTKFELDDLDFQILKFLQEDSRIAFTNIAKKLNIPDTTVHFRVKKLREIGAIKKFTVIVSQLTLGYHIVVFVQIKVSGHIVEDISKKRLDELTEYLSGLENVKFLANTSEPENTICALILAKDEEEMERILSEFNHNPDIGELSVLKITNIVKGEGFTDL